MTRWQYLGGMSACVLALNSAARPVQAQQHAPERVPISVLQRYAGDYDQNGTTVSLRLSGDTLFRVGAGQRVVMVPISETLFRIGRVITAEFVIDQTGDVTQIVSDGVDVEFRLPRKGNRAAPKAAPPVTGVRVPRSVLERYVGTYEYLPGQMNRTDLRVVVRLRGDTLTRTTGGEEVALIPVSETRFMVGPTSLVTEFVVDDAGVTQVMGSGFQQLLARLAHR